MTEYGLIGAKLGHSFSKEIHSMIADYDYGLIELNADELVDFLKEKNFKAVNVTIPYKQDVIPLLDEITDEAKSIGAVNCIKNDGGKLIGHNTDFDGLMALINHAGVNVKGEKVLILGTGGTSDTANGVCRALGAKEIIKVSRSGKNKAATYEQVYANHKDAGVIINTTPCGMYPNIYKAPLDICKFNSLKGVLDVVYNPLKTQLVSRALSEGIKAEGGLYMLVAQAVKASEFFLSAKYERSLTDKIYSKLHAQKSNIILTGMPASGKTTIGKLIAAALGREFYDADELITEKQGMAISEIFEKYGEAVFRDMESEAIKEASQRSGIVIATGGGAVLRKENTDALKMNGKIFFIDRDPKLLAPTADRPTAFNRQEIMKRYEERYPVYISTADYVIKNETTAAKAAERILEELK